MAMREYFAKDIVELGLNIAVTMWVDGGNPGVDIRRGHPLFHAGVVARNVRDRFVGLLLGDIAKRFEQYNIDGPVSKGDVPEMVDMRSPAMMHRVAQAVLDHLVDKGYDCKDVEVSRIEYEGGEGDEEEGGYGGDDNYTVIVDRAHHTFHTRDLSNTLPADESKREDPDSREVAAECDDHGPYDPRWGECPRCCGITGSPSSKPEESGLPKLPYRETAEKGHRAIHDFMVGSGYPFNPERTLSETVISLLETLLPWPEDKGD